MTTQNKNDSSSRAVLKLSRDRLGLSSSGLNKTATAGHNKAPIPSRVGSSVIVITKKSNVSRYGDGQSSSLSQDEKLKRLSLLRMAEEEKQKKAGLNLQPQIEQETEEKEADDVPCDSNNTEIHEERDEVSADEQKESDLQEAKKRTQEKLERGHYIKGLSAGRGRVRDLNHIAIPKVEVPNIPEVITIAPAQEQSLDQKTEAKKPGVLKRKDKALNSEEQLIVANKKSQYNLSPELQRLNRQTNKGSLSRFAIAVSDMEEDEQSSYGRKNFYSVKKSKSKNKKKQLLQPQEKILREVLIPDFISIYELSNRMTEKAVDLIRALMKMGMIVTLNQLIDADTAELVVTEFGHKPKRVTDAEFEKSILKEESNALSSQETRAPVVTIMGHVDHGKTSLLDALRLTDVVAKEAGGITQHIGAYNVKLHSGKHITFLDTPGHEAFTAMRMRGARVTDIVVLVVAIDDGIKEQTIEAISHARAASVPIIVAINKIDKPGSSSERIKNELLAQNLIPEEMGGDTMIVHVSAKTKEGLDKLEEAILSQAEILDLKANYNIAAQGAVIEASINKSKGPVATLLVQQGVLKPGAIVVAGVCYGKVKAMLDDKGEQITSAGPSIPVEVLGLNRAPVAGEVFSVVKTESLAKELADFRAHKEKERKFVIARKDSLGSFCGRVNQDSERKNLPVIIKADVNGSAEAIVSSLMKITHEEVGVQVLHSGVGGITESDITLAAASSAVVLGFNVRANSQARDAAKQMGVDIRYYSIIYNLVDEIKAAVSGMLSPVIREKLLGYVEIRQVFDLSKFGKVAGCTVIEGIIQRQASARLLRDNVVIHEGKLKALKRFKDDVKEVKAGFECGLSFEKYDDIKIGDKVEVFSLVEEVRHL